MCLYPKLIKNKMLKKPIYGSYKIKGNIFYKPEKLKIKLTITDNKKYVPISKTNKK